MMILPFSAGLIFLWVADAAVAIVGYDRCVKTVDSVAREVGVAPVIVEVEGRMAFALCLSSSAVVARCEPDGQMLVTSSLQPCVSDGQGIRLATPVELGPILQPEDPGDLMRNLTDPASNSSSSSDRDVAVVPETGPPSVPELSEPPVTEDPPAEPPALESEPAPDEPPAVSDRRSDAPRSPEGPDASDGNGSSEGDKKSSEQSNGSDPLDSSRLDSLLDSAPIDSLLDSLL
jgi:hypothetical protein